VTSGMTDSDLVERSLADAVVFAVIFDRHHSELSLRAPAGRARAAGDVAAETFVIAFAHQAAWRADGGSARLWLYGIAHSPKAMIWRTNPGTTLIPRLADVDVWTKDEAGLPL
jgi:DNA-directed RNA polymerase specialized sigma24 family protein